MSNGEWVDGVLADLVFVNPDKPSAIAHLDEFRYVDIGCISSNGLLPASSIEIVARAVAPSRAQRRIIEGDVLVGTVRPEREARGRVGADMDEQVASSGICVLRPKLESDADFIYSVVRDAAFTDWCVNHSTGTSYPAVSASDISRYPLHIPSEGERERIASVLGALDDRIDALTQLQRTLHDQGLAEFELACEMNSSQIRLEDVAEVLMGNSPPGTSYNEDEEGTPLFQGCGEFGSYFPVKRLFTTAPGRIAERGDVLVSVRAPVGRLNRAYERCCIGRGLAAIRSKEFTSTLYYALASSAHVWDPYNAEGTVFGSINGGNLRGLGIQWPENSELEERLATLDRCIARYEDEVRELRKSRDFLLPRLISGELRVRAAEEMAEALL